MKTSFFSESYINSHSVLFVLSEDFFGRDEIKILRTLKVWQLYQVDYYCLDFAKIKKLTNHAIESIYKFQKNLVSAGKILALLNCAEKIKNILLSKETKFSLEFFKTQEEFRSFQIMNSGVIMDPNVLDGLGPSVRDLFGKWLEIGVEVGLPFVDLGSFQWGTGFDGLEKVEIANFPSGKKMGFLALGYDSGVANQILEVVIEKKDEFLGSGLTIENLGMSLLKIQKRKELESDGIFIEKSTLNREEFLGELYDSKDFFCRLVVPFQTKKGSFFLFIRNPRMSINSYFENQSKFARAL